VESLGFKIGGLIGELEEQIVIYKEALENVRNVLDRTPEQQNVLDKVAEALGILDKVLNLHDKD